MFHGALVPFAERRKIIMKEINIGRVLIKNRHKRGITQDELANHLGVSKGAVSKWETGVSHS